MRQGKAERKDFKASEWQSKYIKKQTAIVINGQSMFKIFFDLISSLHTEKNIGGGTKHEFV